MSWIDKVPAWVIPLVQEYAVPDDAQVQTGIDFDTFEDGDGSESSQEASFSMSYPGLVPSYSLEPIVTPQTGGLLYVLKAKKGVGFYGCKTDIISYESKKINSWTFPIERKNFGWISLGREDTVLTDKRIAYASEVHLCVPATLLLLNYDDQFDQENLFNSADKLCATDINAQLSPTVKVTFTPLPVWEVWAVRFFSESQ